MGAVVRRILLALLACLPAFGAIITSNATGGGDWAAGATWVGGVAPGIGDTAIIAVGDNVHITTTVTVGASTGAATLAAITLGTTGTFTVDSGGTLNVRGDISRGVDAHLPSATAFTVGAGGTFAWDSSVSGTAYAVIDTGNTYRPIVFAGTSADCAYSATTRLRSGTTCATVTSILTGSGVNGSFGNSAQTFEGDIQWDYAAISNCGTASVPCAHVRNSTFTTPNFSHFWVAHSSITLSGKLAGFGGADYNVRWNDFSAGLNTVNYVDISIADGGSALSKVMTDNAFDLGRQFTNMTTWTLDRNYLGCFVCETYSVASLNDGRATTESESYMRIPHDTATPSGTGSYLYFFYDNSTGTSDNPHFWFPFTTALFTGGTISWSNLIFESSDDVTIDSGEAVQITQNPSTATVVSVSNSLLLPSKTQHGTAEIASLTGNNTLANLTVIFDHWAVAPSGAFGAIQVDEGTNITDITVGSFRASIVADLSGGAATGLKMNEAPDHQAAPRVDVCAPANCDYNDGFNLALTKTCAGCTNQGRSYMSAWTVTPGAHDITGDPQYVSTHRRLATWDTLGPPARAACTAWGTGVTYTPGTCVSVNNGAGVYQGDTINYFYISTAASHTSGASTKPDSGASWRTDWEYASAQDLRGAFVLGTTYSGDSPVKALIKWVQGGWTPTNATFRITFPGDTNMVTNLGPVQMTSACGSIQGACSIPKLPACGIIMITCGIP